MTRRNVRTAAFKRMQKSLPQDVQDSALDAYRLFRANPSHRSLRVHELRDTHTGRHVKGSVSVSISAKYRAIYFIDGDRNVWYWVGSHSEYNAFTGGK